MNEVVAMSVDEGEILVMMIVMITISVWTFVTFDFGMAFDFGVNVVDEGKVTVGEFDSVFTISMVYSYLLQTLTRTRVHVKVRKA